MERFIGDIDSGSKENLLICIGSIHGNEPAGTKALETVFREIQQRNIQIKGRFIGLIGNLQATQQKKRFLDYDLNRLWSEENIDKALEDSHELAEYLEIKELVTHIWDTHPADYANRYFLDLHTTSAENGIFLIVNNLNKLSSLAHALQVPLLTGLDNQLYNTTIPYMTRHGFQAVGFESGQHDAQSSIDNAVTVIWRMLAHIGMIQAKDIPATFLQNMPLKAFSDSLPTVMNVEYCHKIHVEDRFEMLPNFKNFDPIHAGQPLANDQNGQINAKQDGFILMPLYQKQGKDGFFMVSDATKSVL